MANKSKVISGMGVAFSLLQKLVASIREAGGTNDDIHYLVTPAANGVWVKLANLVVGADKKVIGEQSKKVQCFEARYFSKETNPGWIVEQDAKVGNRPATLREMLEFSEANPEIDMDLTWFGFGRDGHYRFLVRK